MSASGWAGWVVFIACGGLCIYRHMVDPMFRDHWMNDNSNCAIAFVVTFFGTLLFHHLRGKKKNRGLS